MSQLITEERTDHSDGALKVLYGRGGRIQISAKQSQQIQFFPLILSPERAKQKERGLIA